MTPDDVDNNILYNNMKNYIIKNYITNDNPSNIMADWINHNKYKNNLNNVVLNAIDTTSNSTSNKMLRNLLLTIADVKNVSKNRQHQIEELERDCRVLKKRVEEYEQALQADLHCTVCLSQPKNYAFVACGHMCVCGTCADRCGNKCPLCRAEGNIIRVIY